MRVILYDESIGQGENMLTAKQEKYVRERVKGKTQLEAYSAAYNTKGRDPDSIYASASRLEKKPEVAKRLDDLMRQAAKRAEQETVKSQQKDVKQLNNAIDMRARIIQAYQEIAFGDDDETTDECAVDPETGTEVVAKRTKTAHKHKMARLTALNKLAEIYAVNSEADEAGIKVEIPEDYKEYLT